MSASLASFRAETSHWEPKFPFDIFVAYDDDITREHALVLKDRLSDVLKDDFDVCCSWWKFHCMLQPELLDRAVDAVVHGAPA